MSRGLPIAVRNDYSAPTTSGGHQKTIWQQGLGSVGEACTDPSDVKNRRKSILTTLGLYMLRRPCCHADFLMSDTRCRRGKIVSDCNREPTGHLEVCSDSVHPTLSTRGTGIGHGQPFARKWTKVDGPRHYPLPQDVLSGTMFIYRQYFVRFILINEKHPTLVLQSGIAELVSYFGYPLHIQSRC